MKKYSFLLVIISFSFGCNTTDPYSNLKKLEFEIIGGFAGSQNKTVIYENGKVTFTDYRTAKKFVINTTFSRKQIDSINNILTINDIFDLSDVYKLDTPIIDGITISLSFYTETSHKNIHYETEAQIPKQMENIINLLFNINSKIQMNPDYGTLIPLTDQTEIIKKWIFPEVNLTTKNYFYSVLTNSDSIMVYFDDIKSKYGYNILYWNQDSLFEIYNESSYGYFNVHLAYPVKYLQNEFNIDLETLKSNGLVFPASEWINMNLSFNKIYVYIIDQLKDEGKAVKVRLQPGKPE